MRSNRASNCVCVCVCVCVCGGEGEKEENERERKKKRGEGKKEKQQTDCWFSLTHVSLFLGGFPRIINLTSI